MQQNAFEKYKTRIVVKGFAQEAELDFDQTFAPVIRIDSVRSLFAICAANDLCIIQVDCFLHSRSDFEIYLPQPEGFIDANHPDAVLLLNKALYGLKQAPRLWYLLLSDWWTSHYRFTQLQNPILTVILLRKLGRFWKGMMVRSIRFARNEFCKSALYMSSNSTNGIFL